MGSLKRKKILQYDLDSMKKAVEAVKRGVATQTAARQFGVPKTTLHYHVIGKYELEKPIGFKTAFTTEEEQMLVKWVLDSACKGFPITKGNFLFSVSQLAKELNIQFIKDKPSRSWFEGFMKRHPNVSLRTAQNLTISRAAVTEKNLQSWFSEIFDYLKANKIDNLLKEPEKLFNLDESAFFLNPKQNLVLAGKGEKNVCMKSGSNEKECFSVLIGGNAVGELCPPMVIFDYKRVPSEVANSIPKEWGIGLSDSGWSTYDVFYCYIVNVFYPWVKKHIGFPIILFVDGHTSHLSYQLSVFCAQNEITLVALYPNSTHILQPIDVAVFRSLKQGWREHVNKWKIHHSRPDMKKHEFAPVLQAALNERVTPQMLANGFKKCGLYPWDPSASHAFFKNKENQCPVIENTNTSFTLRRSIKCLEFYIEDDKLSEFKASADLGWTGKNEDKSLFTVWQKMYSDLLSGSTNSPKNYVQTTSILPLQGNSATLMSRNTLPSTSSSEPFVQNMASSSKTPEIEVLELPILTTPLKDSLLDSHNIPTPFKKSLFFPSEQEKETTKRKKEKIPSVVSSKLWQEYSENKRLKKEQQEKEKMERKRLREEKNNTNQLMRPKNRKLNEGKKKASKYSKRCLNVNEESDASEDVEDPGCNFSDRDLNVENFSGKRQEYGINDFVIVNYEEEYFPGQIKDLRINEEKTQKEYQVTVMQMSGPNGWRWPECEDKIWYVEAQMVEKISPPSSSNSRGVCAVPAIFKYRVIK